MARRVDPMLSNPVPLPRPLPSVNIPGQGHSDPGQVPVEQTLIPLPTPENGTVVPPRHSPPDPTNLAKMPNQVDFEK